MERHTRMNGTTATPRHRARSRHTGRHALKAALGLTGLLLLAGIPGCGGHEAGTSAVIYVDAADADWTLPDDYGDGINTIAPAQPILILVQKSATDTTPVAGVDVTVTVGGVSIANAQLLDPATSVQLDNGAGVFQTQTDDHGAIVVLPRGTVTGCTAVPASDVSVTGNLSIGIFISSDSNVWNGTFTYTCKA